VTQQQDDVLKRTILDNLDRAVWAAEEYMLKVARLREDTIELFRRQGLDDPRVT
jgi:hypothetical protein